MQNVAREISMSLKTVPLFNFVPRISEDPNVDPDHVSLRRLRDVVAGRDTTFSRSRAMAILQATDFPNKHRDFEAVLENDKESPEIRYLAALNLGQIATPAAMEILVKHSRVRDEHVLTGVMKALGRIGNESALDAISIANTRATGLAAMQAEFAATLIAHRIGLQEGDSSVPETRDYLEVDLQCARPFRITRADDADAEFCLRSLGGQTFGIEFSEHPMYQAQCGRNSWMILLNRDLRDKNSMQTLRQRKAFVGVVALRREEIRSYSVVYLLLTSHVQGHEGINISIYRTNGNLSFSGKARCERDSADFSIRALPRPGAFAVKIEGTFEDGSLDIKTALSTTFVQKKREPIEERGAQVEGES
jgi:HEAT repeats